MVIWLSGFHPDDKCLWIDPSPTHPTFNKNRLTSGYVVSRLVVSTDGAINKANKYLTRMRLRENSGHTPRKKVIVLEVCE